MADISVGHVPLYPKVDDAGGGALQALHAALRALGAHLSYPELLVLSGAAFAFVYDNAPVCEPQRDLLSVDVLGLGAAGAGFTGRWLVDEPDGDTLDGLAAALADGRPAVVSLYSVEGLHRYGVAVGLDTVTRQLLVQADQLYTIELPPVWWGAVTGPRAWGARPVFLLEPRPQPGWTVEGRLYRALARGAALLAGGYVPYVDCEGSREFSAVPLSGRQASYGLPAYDLLAADIAGAESLGSFALIWRIDAQVSQLKHNRETAAAYLRTVPHPAAVEAAETCAELADTAADLLARFWYRPTRDMKSAADVMAAAATQPAMLFWLGLDQGELGRLMQRMAATRTPWGPVAIVDTVPRRREALALVERMRALDERLIRQLSQLRDAL